MTVRRSIATLTAGVAAVPTFALTLVLVATVAQPSGGAGPGAITAAGDIPAEYLALYQAAAAKYELGPEGWSYLAGVGKIECDHGRSTAYGCDRGEANSAGAMGPAQFLRPTWDAYGVDANGDGVRDIYDPADAVYGMANYLHASGAPADWHRALYAYNHSEAYVADVTEQAKRYAAAASVPALPSVPITRAWLQPLPSFPSEQCDSRIVPDVEMLVHAYGLVVSDCYGGAPHAINGEHPLGLAIDASPADGDWGRTMLLARNFGWSEACAAAGCPGVGPFRVILYNGYPGHGDPAHTSKPHIHVSWEHSPAAPFSQADAVRTLLAAPMATARPCRGGRSHNRRRGARRSCDG